VRLDYKVIYISQKKGSIFEGKGEGQGSSGILLGAGRKSLGGKHKRIPSPQGGRGVGGEDGEKRGIRKAVKRG